MAKVFIAVPTGNGQVDGGTTISLLGASRKHIYTPKPQGCGALCLNFNALWTEALNGRGDDGYAWFAMLHADVCAEMHWLDTLIDLAEEHDADLMSAVVPIKDGRGVTSTSLSDPDDDWHPWCRLTQTQLHHESFPETFDTEIVREALANLPDDLRVECPLFTQLQANVGCMVVNIAKPWSSVESILENKLWFNTQDELRIEADNLIAKFRPDDWIFSRRLSAIGCKVMCTKKVKTIHRGPESYPSSAVWGQDRDDEFLTRVRNGRQPFDEAAVREALCFGGVQ